MNTITIQIPDDRWSELQKLSDRLGITSEALLLKAVKELTTESEASFQSAMNYVLDKNAELYKRLA